MEIQNKQFRAALERAGLQDYHLWKDSGYFHVYSDDPEIALELTRVSTSIFVYKFTDMTVQEWIGAIQIIHQNRINERTENISR